MNPKSLSNRKRTPRAYDFSSGLTVLMSMMTDGVWAIAPIILQPQITHRKVRKASWQPGRGHLPGTAVAKSLYPEIHAHPDRF